MATGKEVRRFEAHHGRLRSAMLSPEGKQVLTASYKVARLLETATGKELRRFEGHGHYVHAAVS